MFGDWAFGQAGFGTRQGHQRSPAGSCALHRPGGGEAGMRVGRVGCATEPGRPQLCLQLGLQQLRPAVESRGRGLGCVLHVPLPTHMCVRV